MHRIKTDQRGVAILAVALVIFVVGVLGVVATRISGASRYSNQWWSTYRTPTRTPSAGTGANSTGTCIVNGVLTPTTGGVCSANSGASNSSSSSSSASSTTCTVNGVVQPAVNGQCTATATSTGSNGSTSSSCTVNGQPVACQ